MPALQKISPRNYRSSSNSCQQTQETCRHSIYTDDVATGGRNVFASVPAELVAPATIGGKKTPACPVFIEAAEVVSDGAVVVGACVDGPTILVSVTIWTGAVIVSTPALPCVDVVGLSMLANCDANADAAGALSLLVVVGEVVLLLVGIDAVVVTVTVTVAAVAGSAPCGMTKFGAKFTAAG
jgi:hypothetical protein